MIEETDKSVNNRKKNITKNVIIVISVILIIIPIILLGLSIKYYKYQSPDVISILAFVVFYDLGIGFLIINLLIIVLIWLFYFIRKRKQK